MAPSFAELALSSASAVPRLSVDHVAALVEADAATRKHDAERAVRSLKKQRRLASEQMRRVAAAKGER